MLNKEATRFVNRKNISALLADKPLTDYHISRLNKLFETNTCKQLENMHLTIAKFVLNDLNNYEGRLRRLQGIPGTTRYTQLLRYGKHNFLKILSEQTTRKTKHFENKTAYWVNLGFSESEALQQVSDIQTSRSLLSPAAQHGSREHSVRCVEYWIKNGYSADEAVIQVASIQRRKHTAERNKRWQETINSKPAEEIALINRKKGHSVEAYKLKGFTDEDAIIASNKSYAKRNNFSQLSQTFFILLEQYLNSNAVYYKIKNYEKQFNGKCVDFYDANSNTVIEFYGDFWHRNPMTYNEQFTCYGKTSKEIWEYDAVRIDLIKKHKDVAKLIIVWESAVIKNPQAEVNRIIKEIQNDRN